MNIATNKLYDYDLSFYAFQSAPKKNPELLLLGINPGCEYTYADQFKNPDWGLIKDKRMTAEVFYASSSILSHS